MFCQKQPRTMINPSCCLWCLLSVLAVIGAVLYFKKTRSGKCMMQKASRIKESVEDAVCSELSDDGDCTCLTD